jgi:hypothetical protein
MAPWAGLPFVSPLTQSPWPWKGKSGGGFYKSTGWWVVHASALTEVEYDGPNICNTGAVLGGEWGSIPGHVTGLGPGTYEVTYSYVMILRARSGGSVLVQLNGVEYSVNSGTMYKPIIQSKTNTATLTVNNAGRATFVTYALHLATHTNALKGNAYAEFTVVVDRIKRVSK